MSQMAALTEHVSYADAQRLCSPARLWELFDGDRELLNIAHECIDRHPRLWELSRGARELLNTAQACIAPHPAARAAVRIAPAAAHGGPAETLPFGALADLSSRFAHFLAARGIGAGDRVGIMLEP